MRWGIFGCGNISNDFVNALQSVKGATAVACAARSQASSSKFGETHGIANCFDSYTSVCAYPAVEVVYIGTIHTQHFEHTKLALMHGKHVLVEKPFAMNLVQATELVQLAKSKGLFLMEGMWTRFFPIVRKVRELLRNGAIGDILTANAAFGVCIPKTVERLWKKELGGGALLDLGIYPIAFLSMVFGGQSPVSVHAQGAITAEPEGVDYFSNITLRYSDQQFATAQVSSIATIAEEVDITGTTGRIKIHASAHIAETISVFRFGATRDDTTEEVIRLPIPTAPCTLPSAFNFPGSNGFQFEAESVESCIQSGLLENPEYTLAESLVITKILQDCRVQLGVKYDCDN